jgi:ABC-type transporter Mla subunit MlaD
MIVAVSPKLRALPRHGQHELYAGPASPSKELLMANTRLASLSRWLPLLFLLAVSGCTFNFDQPLRAKTPNDPNKLLESANQPPPANSQIAAAQAAAKGLPPPPGPSPDQISQLLQRLASVEDDRKIQAARLNQVETQLRDKDQAVIRATYEIQDSTAQMKKAREDVLRWKTEMDDLRGKLRTIEQENKLTLDAILRTLEQYIDKEAPRFKS